MADRALHYNIMYDDIYDTVIMRACRQDITYSGQILYQSSTLLLLYRVFMPLVTVPLGTETASARRHCSVTRSSLRTGRPISLALGWPASGWP